MPCFSVMAIWNTCTYSIILFSVLQFNSVLCDIVATCQPKDFHYEYTECDSKGGRWRVSVPTPGICTGGAPNPPIRGKDCAFTCAEGTYLDIQGNQTCLPCPAGTYSLGGGKLYDDWTAIPPDFSIESRRFIDDKDSDYTSDKDHSGRNSDKSAANCSGSEWSAHKDYVMVTPRDCVSTLSLAAVLVKPGFIKFDYQHTDQSNFFKFTVKNEMCQMAGDKDSNKWPKVTKNGLWSTLTVLLKTGTNIMSWKVMNLEIENDLVKPVLLKNIKISGIAFTSECTHCKAGTFSEAGSLICKDCARNTFSQRGSPSCQPCDKATEYSLSRSEKCSKKPPCKLDDYFSYTTPCDKNHRTKLKYQWKMPRQCRSDIPGAVKLPTDGPLEDCPSCNPGMEFINGTGCRYCTKNTYSDGGSAPRKNFRRRDNRTTRADNNEEEGVNRPGSTTDSNPAEQSSSADEQSNT